MLIAMMWNRQIHSSLIDIHTNHHIIYRKQKFAAQQKHSHRHCEQLRHYMSRLFELNESNISKCWTKFVSIKQFKEYIQSNSRSVHVFHSTQIHKITQQHKTEKPSSMIVRWNIQQQQMINNHHRPKQQQLNFIKI